MIEKVPHASPPGDEWTARLRAAVQKDRRRFRLAVWSLLFASLVVIGLGVWRIYLHYLHSTLPPVAIVAIDGLCIPGEPARVRAQIEAIEEKNASAFMDELNVAFHGQLDDTSAKARSKGNGEAQANLQFPRQVSESEFRVQLSCDDRRSTIEDSARIFFWLSKTKIVLVDVSDLLADRQADLGKRDLNSLQADQDLARVLWEVHNRKYKIVYLAIKSERVLDYQMSRRWKESKKHLLPPGPVLARPSYHNFGPQSTNEAQARRRLVQDLQEHYEVRAITRLNDTAEIYEQEKIRYVVFDATGETWKKLLD